jgi:hypothetical protein
VSRVSRQTTARPGSAGDGPVRLLFVVQRGGAATPLVSGARLIALRRAARDWLSGYSAAARDGQRSLTLVGRS